MPTRQFKFRHLEKVVGGFVFVSIGIVFFAILAIGKGQGWFEKSYHYRVIFSKGYGLKPGATVTLSGIDIGLINSVGLTPENIVEVQMEVQERYRDRIRMDSLALVGGPPLLGSKYLEIVPGSPEELLIEEGGLINSEDPKELTDYLEGFDVNAIKGRFEEVLEDVAQLASHLNESSQELIVTISNISEITSQLREGKVGESLEKTLANLEQVTQTLSESSPKIKDAIATGDESLKETKKVIKAVQKSWFVRGNIPQIKEAPVLNLNGRDTHYSTSPGELKDKIDNIGADVPPKIDQPE